MSATSLEIAVRAVNEGALMLHDAAREMRLAAFRRFAFETLQKLVHFDSGLFGIGTLRGGVPEPYDVVLFNQTPALMESWHVMRARDHVAHQSLRAPGRVIVHDSEVVFASDRFALDHCRRFGLRHIASTARIHERARHLGVVSLYRAEDGPYTELERTIIELFVPHFIQCGHTAFGTELHRARSVAPVRTCAVGLVNRDGVLLDFEPELIDHILRIDPRWEGPWVPRSLRACIEARAGDWTFVERCAVRATPHEDVVRLDLRMRLPADALTTREREIARRFAVGESAKEIGEALGISTNTVRVHLGRVYEKLGVENKAELATMLAGLDA